MIASSDSGGWFLGSSGVRLGLGAPSCSWLLVLCMLEGRALFAERTPRKLFRGADSAETISRSRLCGNYFTERAMFVNNAV